MVRRTIPLAAGVVFLLLGAVAASGRSTAADPYAGTWSVANKPGYNQNTPWKNGGSITVEAAHRGDVEPYSDVPGVGGMGATPVKNYCLGFGNPSSDPVVSAWYLLSYNWGDGEHGTMAGCLSNRTYGDPHFWGQGTDGYIQSGPSACGPPGTCLNGYWLNKPGGGVYWTFAASPASAQTTKTVNEPAPGSGVVIDSGNAPADCGSNPGRAPAKLCKRHIDVSKSGGDLRGTEIVDEGELSEDLARATYLFALCWVQFEGTVSPADLVRGCATITRWFLCYGRLVSCAARAEARRAPAGLRQRTVASAPAAGCRSVPVRISFKLRKGKMVSVKRAKTRLTGSSVRYSCSGTGGTEHLTLKGPANLRKSLGMKLGFLVYRAKNAPRTSSKLTFTFGW